MIMETFLNARGFLQTLERHLKLNYQMAFTNLLILSILDQLGISIQLGDDVALDGVKELDVPDVPPTEAGEMNRVFREEEDDDDDVSDSSSVSTSYIFEVKSCDSESDEDDGDDEDR
jgi:hypothetical protein